eukprot:TRINITY_DN7995_c0_g1_i5.p1 TRINITY_DN7995_c0_g1~~TRINITY_DN7995_c0_g1_i5.p1  ORF type:complete len:382 (+),score=61.59 TRINITY_DN7995_c0_g1_i5:65-1210(+)
MNNSNVKIDIKELIVLAAEVERLHELLGKNARIQNRPNYSADEAISSVLLAAELERLSLQNKELVAQLTYRQKGLPAAPGEPFSLHPEGKVAERRHHGDENLPPSQNEEWRAKYFKLLQQVDSLNQGWETKFLALLRERDELKSTLNRQDPRSSTLSDPRRPPFRDTGRIDAQATLRPGAENETYPNELEYWKSKAIALEQETKENRRILEEKEVLIMDLKNENSLLEEKLSRLRETNTLPRKEFQESVRGSSGVNMSRPRPEQYDEFNRGQPGHRDIDNSRLAEIVYQQQKDISDLKRMLSNLDLNNRSLLPQRNYNPYEQPFLGRGSALDDRSRVNAKFPYEDRQRYGSSERHPPLKAHINSPYMVDVSGSDLKSPHKP